MATTRGESCSAIREKRRKSAGTNSTRAPLSTRKRSAGPKKPERYRTPGSREDLVEVDEQRAEHRELGEVVAVAERVQERARLARAERDGERVDGCGPAAAASAGGSVRGAMRVTLRRARLSRA